MKRLATLLCILLLPVAGKSAPPGHPIPVRADSETGQIEGVSLLNFTGITVIGLPGGGGGGSGTVTSITGDNGSATGLTLLIGGTAQVPTVTLGGTLNWGHIDTATANVLPQTAITGLATTLAVKANDNAVIHTTGNEAKAGVLTFSSAPVVPNASFPESATTNLVTDLAAKQSHSTNLDNVSAIANTPFGLGFLAQADGSASRNYIGLGNVDNTSDATKNAAAATLTNHTISGQYNTILDIPLNALPAGSYINLPNPGANRFLAWDTTDDTWAMGVYGSGLSYNHATHTLTATGSGTGDVTGPSSSTNNHVAFFAGTTGKALVDSGLTLSGSNTGDQIVPSNTTATASQFLTAYNSSSGAFTKTQPGFSDLGGSITNAMVASNAAIAWSKVNKAGSPLVFLVENYGAVGDGVTDDAAAIQAAIDAAVAAGGGDIVFCNKTYRLNNGSTPKIFNSSYFHILVQGGTTTTVLRFIGNGARFYTDATIPGSSPLLSMNMICFDTDFDTITFEHFGFERANQHLNGFTGGIVVAPHSGNTANLFRIHKCGFKNVRRNDLGAPSDATWRGRLAKFEVTDCGFDYPWGSNTADATGAPNVAMFSSWWADEVVCDRNTFDGGADVSNSTNTPNHQPMDGILISESRRTFFRDNPSIKNFWVEGILVGPQGGLTGITSGFTMPAVGADVTVSYTAFPSEATLLPVGATIHIANSSDGYTPAGQFTIQSINTTTHSMVARNTGYTGGGAANAAPGTSIGSGSALGLINPLSEPVAVITGNDFDQRQTTGGPTPGNPCIAAYFGKATIERNTMRNVIWGTSLSPGGSRIGTQWTEGTQHSKVASNHIYLRTFVAPTLLSGIRSFVGSEESDIAGNFIFAPVSTGVTGILAVAGQTVHGNAVKAGTLAFNATYPSIAYAADSGTTRAIFDANIAENLDTGYGGGATSYTLGRHTETNVPTQASGSMIYADPTMTKTVSFTPTTAGWYRVVTASGEMGGEAAINQSDGGAPSDIFFHYNVAGYGQASNLTQLRKYTYSGGGISQARISTDGSTSGVYLDIYVDGAASTQKVYVSVSGRESGQLVNAPVVGASVVGNLSVKTLTFAEGISTTGDLMIGGLTASQYVKTNGSKVLVSAATIPFADLTGAQAGIQYKDEGSNLGTANTITSVDFVGTGVTATRSTNALTITIPGASGGAVATDTIWDAKGDLAVGTGADTAVKLGVGVDDWILIADSSRSVGMRWDTTNSLGLAKLTADQTFEGTNTFGWNGIKFAVSGHSKSILFTSDDDPNPFVDGLVLGASQSIRRNAGDTAFEAFIPQAHDVDLDTWATITPGTGVGTALAVNVGSAGALVTNGGALGTPSSGTVTNLTGTASININGTVGATTPAAGTFTTLTNTGAATNSKSGAASTPALTLSGVPFAGTGTNSFPLIYINDANATASTTLNTAGTYFGVNGDGTQDLMNLLKDGTSQFKVGSTGTLQLLGQISSINLDVYSSTSFATSKFQIYGPNAVTYMSSDWVYEWASTADANGTIDTTLSRSSAGTLRFGTTAANASGSWAATNGTLSGTLSVTGAVTQTAKTTTYNNIATEGNGLGAIVKATRVTAQTAANASIATYTTPAADGSYLVSGNLNITAAVAVSTSLNCDYTDETNTARTMIIPISGLGGTFLAGGLATSTGPFESTAMHIRTKASTAITIYTAAGTFTAVTYNAEGVIRQLQ